MLQSQSKLSVSAVSAMFVLPRGQARGNLPVWALQSRDSFVWRFLASLNAIGLKPVVPFTAKNFVYSVLIYTNNTANR